MWSTSSAPPSEGDRFGCATPVVLPGSGADDAPLRAALLTAGAVSDAGWYAGTFEGLLRIGERWGTAISHQQTRTPSEYDEAFLAYGTDFGVFNAVREAVAEGETVWAIGMNRDQNGIAPEVTLGSAVIRIDSMRTEIRTGAFHPPRVPFVEGEEGYAGEAAAGAGAGA